jgi:hypothetical protein
MTHLAIRYNAATKAHEVVLVSSDGVLTTTEHLEDARRIAQSISAWTQLPVAEA